MAIGPLPPVISEIQANSGQPGKTLAQQTAASSLLDLQTAAMAEPATAILPETTLLEKAVAEALGHQGGLAPLYATLAELADAPDLPEAVKVAIDTILALRLGDGDVTPARVAEAIRSSGVFHEAVAAGKMAAALPPAVRRALEGATGEGRPATTRVAPPNAPSATSAVMAGRVATAPPPAVPTPVSAAAQAYGRQGGSPPVAVTPVTPQASSAGVAVGPPVTPNATVEIVPASGPASAPAGAPLSPTSAAPPSAIAAAAPVPAATAGLASSTGLQPPAPPVVGSVREAMAAPPAQVVSGAPEAKPGAPATSGAGAVPLSSPLSPAASAMSAAPSQMAEPASVSGQAAQSPASPSLTTSDPTEARPSPQPPPAGSLSSSAQASAASRSFAPWTPGRPFTPATPATSSPVPSGSPGEGGHPASSSTVIPAGGEIASPRVAGDRTPFVPSAVESLPNAASGAVAPRAMADPAVLPHVQEAPVQPAAGPLSTAAFPSGPASEPEAGQIVPQPQPASQHRAPAGVEISATLSRQSALQSSQPTATVPLMESVDLKGALDILRRELVTWLGRSANVMAGLERARGDLAASRIDRPPPPRKNSPVRGQPAVPLMDGEESETASTETLAGRALGEAERSLSRVFLHQAAAAEGRDLKAAQPTQALMLEIPIVGPNGTSVAQLRIERDDHAPSEPGAPPRRIFQVDIAFDVAPLGPVAVRVGLMDGRRVAVGVWCESDDGLVRMEAERENIVLGLEQEGMVVAGVDLHRGHPSEGHDETAAAPNHRLDLQL